VEVTIQLVCNVQDLVLRVCFILGNLTAKLENARSHLFAQSSAVETLLSIFNRYSVKDIKVCGSHCLAERNKFSCVFRVQPSPLTSAWPYLNSDIGLEDGEY